MSAAEKRAPLDQRDAKICELSEANTRLAQRVAKLEQSNAKLAARCGELAERCVDLAAELDVRDASLSAQREVRDVG